jgi:hypothetical protein
MATLAASTASNAVDQTLIDTRLGRKTEFIEMS